MRHSSFFSRQTVSLLLLTTLLIACSPDLPLSNLALRHPAFHSSSIDFNATAQLAVDGIIETEPPCRVEVCGNGGQPLGKLEHDLPFEPRQWTALSVEGSSAELSVRTRGFIEAVDRVSMTWAAKLPETEQKAPFAAELQRLDEAGHWQAVRRFEGIYTGGRLTLDWDAPDRMAPEGWRFTLEIPSARSIEWQEWRFYRDGRLLPMLTSEHFSSVWMSAGGGREWLAVDLGEVRDFREVRLHWLAAPAHGRLQTGPDTLSWRDVAPIGGEVPVRSDTLHVRGRGRWIRLLLDASTDGKPYVLSELEVLGKAPARPVTSEEQPAVTAGRRFDLDRGWQLARLPQAGDPTAWIPATVPGTVLVSYLDNGMLPDPNFGDNQQYISDSYFLSPFLYRCRFTLPEGSGSGLSDERVRLHFDGINWKADIALNGTAVGRIEGAFTDASFDITPLLAEDNLLEVTVFPPAHPGMAKGNTLERCATNGGVLGADNPTFHASVGWDWIPTIRGRNTGIWNDVWIERHGPVRILHPTVQTHLACQETLPPQIDTTRAFITLGATLVNEGGHPVETTWEGSYGTVTFHKKVLLKAGEKRPVQTTLQVDHPRLWWPNGYGEPNLYAVRMRAGESDSLAFQSGIRQLTYDTSGGNLRIWINGRRLVGRGGNWGFSESNLRYKTADYEMAMQLHRHENFNMVRNWVGMIGDPEFYDAADRNGLLVWQDFWLANPSDGPDPDDETLFMQNAENLMLRIRHHPCLLLWCGRNEGYPPRSLDRALRELVHENDPERFYLSSSADEFVSGRGPYNRLPQRAYYRLSDIPWFRDESVRFHSERGMPNFPNYESLVQMMPASEAWPPSRLWGIHDFALQSAQKGETFIAAVDSAFGPSSDAPTFSARAQWINFEGYRAMFESRSRYRRGLLLWMSHPAWPSMAFCTYDWFLDPTASYYACRKACEPIHIQWNPDRECVEAVNVSAGARPGLRAVAKLYNLGGTAVSTQAHVFDACEDSTTDLFGIDFSTAGFAPGDTLSTGVCFLRLQLFDGAQVLSSNDYVLPQRTDNLRILNSLPKTGITAAMAFEKSVPAPAGAGMRNRYTVTLSNPSERPALMLHLTAHDERGERILPLFWSDNYLHLMPGETRTLILEIPVGSPAVRFLRIEGFNTGRQEIRGPFQRPRH